MWEKTANQVGADDPQTLLTMQLCSLWKVAGQGAPFVLQEDGWIILKLLFGASAQAGSAASHGGPMTFIKLHISYTHTHTTTMFTPPVWVVIQTAEQIKFPTGCESCLQSKIWQVCALFIRLLLAAYQRTERKFHCVQIILFYSVLECSGNETDEE